MSPTIPPGPRGKLAARRSMLARRDALSSVERAVASAHIASAIEALLAAHVQSGSLIALYAPKASEVDTTEIDRAARARGLVVGYPRVIDGTRELEFSIAQRSELVPARFGLHEPRLDAPSVALGDIAAFIVPGLAFDREGARIGWGRGHYDATFARASHAIRIGLAFECQIADRLPRDPHDVAMHYIVSEVATYRVA